MHINNNIMLSGAVVLVYGTLVGGGRRLGQELGCTVPERGAGGSTVKGSSVSPVTLAWRECAGGRELVIKLTALYVKTTI